MFARLVQIEATQGNLSRVIETWNGKDVPSKRLSKGYQGALLFTDSKTGKAISITFWDSLEDASSDEQSSLHKSQLNFYKDLLKPGYTHEYLYVSAWDKTFLQRKQVRYIQLN